MPEAGGLFHQAISQSPPGGLIRSVDASAAQARRFIETIGVDPADGARTVMTARPSLLVRSLERLMLATIEKTPDSFGIGATSGTDYLPVDPIVAMTTGRAHRVPLIVGSNAKEASIFARFMDHLPTNPRVIEHLLSDMEPAAAQRMRASYPGYPHRDACLSFGTDFTFGRHAWQLAEAHGTHAPTYLYRYDYAPRTMNWSGFGATHASELLAVFDVYATRTGSMLTVAGDWRSARHVSRDVQRRWRSFTRAAAYEIGRPSTPSTAPGRRWS